MSKKILLVCWGLMGDVLMRTPLIEALRVKYPGATFVAIADAVGVAVLKNHPALDQVVVFSRQKRPLFRYLLSYVKRMLWLRRQRFDLCVDFYNGRKSPGRVCFIRPKEAVGFVGFSGARKRDQMAKKAFNLPVEFPRAEDKTLAGLHWNTINARLLAPLGVDPSSVRCGATFVPTQAARKFAESFITPRVVVLNLGAGGLEKCWPVELYAALARELSQRCNVAVVSNPGQAYLAEALKAMCPAVTVWPVMSLDRLAALFERVICLVTGDTGLMHLAFGVKAPVVGVYTHTRPEWVAPTDVKHVAVFNEGRAEQNLRGEWYGDPQIAVFQVAAAVEALWMAS